MIKMVKNGEAMLIFANCQKTQTELLVKITEEITSLRKDSEIQTNQVRKMAGKMFGFIFFLICVILLLFTNPALIPTIIPMVK